MKIDSLYATPQIEKQISAWWAAFVNSERAISGTFSRRASFDVVSFMNQYLQSINQDIMWEYGPAIKEEGHRLVITPESELHLTPLVNSILRAAPKIPGWEFYGYRLPEDFKQAVVTVEGRTGRALAKFTVSGEVNEFNQVDLKLAAESTENLDDDLLYAQGYILTECLLGEQTLRKWIGSVDLVAEPQAGHASELSRIVTDMVSEIRNGLPGKPLYLGAESGGTIFKLKPPDLSEYPHQLDLFVGKTINMPMWQTAHSSIPFSSERFSRNNETFCYVKLDGREGLDQESFADKSEIEDAIDVALKSSGLGCFVGGGTGLHHSYIDLAIVREADALRTVCDVLRKGRITKRSWIQFFDSHRQAEWIGIWEDSPPPPMPSF